jgi:sulfite reductase (ferredoxin)
LKSADSWRNVCIGMATNWKKVPISPAQEAELKRFEEEVAALQRGERDPDEFKRFRLENGVYGIRLTTDKHMIRIKIRFGALTPDQLECVADVAEKFTPLKLGHITTRQAIQLHNVEQKKVPEALRMIAESGLTTREACGNTVRNVTCCPFAGVAADEAFDVTPYADAVSAFFLRNPLNQNLPRKFKIAFEGCPTDHARVPIHDFGVVAKMKDGKRGFQVYVGGGLGPIPFSAQLLEDFTPEELLIPSIEAAIRIHDRHGNRKDRNRARIKFLVKDWGIEKFRAEWLSERTIAVNTRSGLADWRIPIVEETAPPMPDIKPATAPRTPEYMRWRQTNCFAQKQKDYFAVHIRCPLGDISAENMRHVAGIARRYCGGRIRTTISQNLLLRWVHESHLANVYSELSLFGLAHHDAEHIADITRCPGADTCNLAITHSRGLAQALGDLFNNGLAQDPLLQNLSIKISGCPNSCGQHHIADIGFFGNSKIIDKHQVGHYRLMLGGGTREGKATFAVPVLSLPAKRIPDAVKKLLLTYKEQRGADESFHDFIQRTGLPHIKQLLDEFTTLPPYSEHPEMYGDLGIEGEFKLEMGKGECAA